MLFGRNPNRPYDVRQLFGGAGSQLDRPKHWDSYEMESQKFLQIGEWWKLNTKFCYCFWRENQASQTNLLIVHTTRSQKWWLSSTISWFLNFIAKTEMVMDYVYQFWIYFPGPIFLLKALLLLWRGFLILMYCAIVLLITTTNLEDNFWIGAVKVI